MSINGRPPGSRLNPYVKDPQSRLDYGHDWTPWLAEVGDTIDTATATASGVTIDSAVGVTGGRASVFVTGGTEGTPASITLHIETTAGRIDERTVHLRIESK